jgi:hypothetical protein
MPLSTARAAFVRRADVAKKSRNPDQELHRCRGRFVVKAVGAAYVIYGRIRLSIDAAARRWRLFEPAPWHTTRGPDREAQTAIYRPGVDVWPIRLRLTGEVDSNAEHR